MRYLPVIVLIVAVQSCVKPPTYPIEPIIEFKSVSSGFIKSGQTDTITITFTDGDGDLWVQANPGDTCNQCALPQGDTSCFYLGGYNVFMIDSRDSCINYFATANIFPVGKFDDISGEISIIRAIDSKACFAPPQPGCPIDSVFFHIMIRDRAGNFSNVVKTTTIAIDGE